MCSKRRFWRRRRVDVVGVGVGVVVGVDVVVDVGVGCNWKDVKVPLTWTEGHFWVTNKPFITK